MLSIIVAVSENNVIGKDNQLLWHLPADLKFFKQTTIGHTIIMGRKTFDSIGKALPGRTTIVVTRQQNFVKENVIVKNSMQDAIEHCKNEAEVFIVGGSEIYNQSMEFSDRIYLTRVHSNFEGDTFFPEINLNKWKLVKEEYHQKDEKNKFDYTFLIYESSQK